MRRLLTAAGAAAALVTAAAGQVPPPPPGGGGYEVLARGPVHEAFAGVVDGKMAATPVVPQPPPPPVDEVPPDLRPAGDGVEWIGGYWHWSDERGGYLWVSGCWRDDPPGRDWLPGQWVRAGGGYHWVSGAWVPEGTSQLTLLPKPPDPIEEDPGPAAAGTSMFVPGTWVWKENRYAWRPGQWVEQPAEWVWQPAQYVWTPGGYLFVDGFWDHPLQDRGFLYAPVEFPRAAAGRRVAYEPAFVVRPAFLEGALFVRSATKHYYFGDYFDRQYQTAGFVPWFDYRTSRVAVDPIYAHYRAYQRGNDWDRSLRALYAARYEGRAARPPRALEPPRDGGRTAAPPAALTPEAARLAPLVNVQQTANVQQVIQQIQTVTNKKVERVVVEQKNRYKEAADRRREAAKGYQELQTQRLATPGGAVPAAPVPIQVPNLPRPARVTPPPAGQPPAGQPPAGQPKPPPAPARKVPPPPRFQPEREPPGKGDPPGKGKGDGKKGDGDKKKDDKKKDTFEAGG